MEADRIRLCEKPRAYFLTADVGLCKQQVVCSLLDHAQVLQQVRVGDALVRAEHVVNGVLVTVYLTEQRLDTCMKSNKNTSIIIIATLKHLTVM